MSKDNSQTKPSESNDEEEKYSRRHRWNYPDLSSGKHYSRTCCSPVDEIEAMANEDETLSTMQSVEVQTEKSSLLLLNQDKRIERSSKQNTTLIFHNKKPADNKRSPYQVHSNVRYYQVNEFENIKLKKTGLNYEDDKVRAKIAAKINAPKTFDEYAETDLDQPMDYALCYNETNLDEEKRGSTPYLTKNDLLCIEEAVEGEKIEIRKSKGTINKEQARNKKEMFGNTGRSFKEIFNFFKDRDKKRSTVEISKPSTLEGSKLLKSTETCEQKVEKLPQSTQSANEQCERETKLKNEAQCSQTLLMFSRCSSLGSLTGFEQNSINDDRSSIVSDISRRTNGVVSPSELPNSPAQTAPPGTKSQLKSQISCFGKKKIQLLQDKFKAYQYPTIANDNSLQNESNLKKVPVAKRSVFEDNLTSFKDESTPTKLHSMAASSLSSLTIDDEDDYEIISKITLNKEKQNTNEEVKVGNNRQESIGKSNLVDTEKSEKSETTFHEQKENLNGEEDDELTDLTPYEEQLLDQCIRRGIAKWTNRNINEIKSFSWDLGLTCRTTRAILKNKLRIHCNTNIQNDIENRRNQKKNQIITDNNNSKFDQYHEIKDRDSCEKFSNEDSDSMKQESNLHEMNDHLNENSYYVTYEEHLLDQCIRRGMAKITKKNINEIRPFSWDVNLVCLTTRAMILHGRDVDIYGAQ